MKNVSYSRVLDRVVREHIPDDVNILPQIMARVAQKEPRSMKTKLKLVWTIVLVVFGLGLATTAAFALYRIIFDPGLQSVQDAGLITNLDVTAQPTILPESDKPVFQPHPATIVGLEQTNQGVTVRLDWIYMEEMHLALGFSVKGLAEGMQFGMPGVDFGAAQAEQYRGGNLVLVPNGNGYQGTLLLNQLVRDGVENGRVDIKLDLPLLELVDGQEKVLSDFVFNLQGVPISAGQTQGGETTYSMRVGGQELRLEFLSLTPHGATASLCQPSGQSQSGMRIQDAVIQYGDPAQMEGKGGTPNDRAISYTGPAGEACERVHFPAGYDGESGTVKVTVDKLAGEDRSVDGPWWFYSAPLKRSAIPGLVEPTPTPEPTAVSQTIGDLTATLNWAYADAQRVAIEVHFSNWKPEWSLYEPKAVDQNGNYLLLDYIGAPQPEDQSTVVIIFSTVDSSMLSGQRVQMSVELPLVVPPEYENVLAAFHFDLDLPVYPETVLNPQLEISANGIAMRLERIQMTPSYTIIILCYDKPTHDPSSDWMVGWQSSLQVANLEAHPTGYQLLSDKDYGGNVVKGSGQNSDLVSDLDRCIKLDYPIGHKGESGTVQVTLSIGELEQSIPEVISDEAVQAANQKLAQDGIQMSWYWVTGDGGGSSGPRILQKPEGMEDAEVIRRFYEALGYYFSGPWSFKVSLQPK